MRAKLNGVSAIISIVGSLFAVLSNTAWLVFMEMIFALINTAFFVVVNTEPSHDR